MDFDKVVKNRRSIRKFVNFKIDDQEIKELMEAARWAPSWINTQCWEFVIIRRQKLIKKIAGCYKLNTAYSCSKNADAIIIACAKRGISGFFGKIKATKFGDCWFMFDLALAVENLVLKAVDLGLGTVIVGSINRQKIEKLINLPAGYEAVVALPIGKPDPNQKKKRQRKKLSQFVWKNIFGKKYFS